MESINLRIRKLMLECGCDPGLKGFRCMEEAIKLFYEDREGKYYSNMTKKLYPEVAIICKIKSGMNAERNMRALVERCLENVDPECIVEKIGNVISLKTGKVRNGTFIAACALRLRSEDEKKNW